MTIDLSRLSEPFPSEDVEWRIGRSGVKQDGTVWAKALAYIDARAIQDRLDDVCGPENWQSRFRVTEGGAVLCDIGIRCGDEWVWKSDGSQQTDIESVKGGISGAFKRAAVHWGIGRLLYRLDETWVDTSKERRQGWNYGKAKDRNKNDVSFYWKTPQLPAWALPQGAKPQQNGAPRQQEPEPEKRTDADHIKRILWEAGCMTAEQVSLVLSYATDGEYTTAEQAKATPEDAAIVLKRLREHAGGYDLLLGKAQTAQQTRQEEAALNNEEETF